MKTALCVVSMVAVLAGPVHAAAAKAPAVDVVELYKVRCQSCHMADGDSPLEPMNFADGKWIHGSKPPQVVAVIAEGVPATAMLPFKDQLTAAEIKALAAYVRAFDKKLAPARKKK